MLLSRRCAFYVFTAYSWRAFLPSWLSFQTPSEERRLQMSNLGKQAVEFMRLFSLALNGMEINTSMNEQERVVLTISSGELERSPCVHPTGLWNAKNLKFKT
jgi:hypothetical protein